jgi:hypothetical protein
MKREVVSKRIEYWFVVGKLDEDGDPIDEITTRWKTAEEARSYYIEFDCNYVYDERFVETWIDGVFVDDEMQDNTQYKTPKYILKAIKKIKGVNNE